MKPGWRHLSVDTILWPDEEHYADEARRVIILYAHTVLVFYMARDLPPFKPVTKAELRYFWSNHPDSRRLVLEIERYRRVIAEIDGLYKTTHQAWRLHLGGNLTALHLLQQVMTEERERLPAEVADRDRTQ